MGDKKLQASVVNNKIVTANTMFRWFRFIRRKSFKLMYHTFLISIQIKCVVLSESAIFKIPDVSFLMVLIAPPDNMIVCVNNVRSQAFY
ncbi:hypothetical protein AMJ86_06415 [bacterium SM23_57]|nr:MAG: hypothetical protein AMJ86_06415 [bacterium SM23_57]